MNNKSSIRKEIRSILRSMPPSKISTISNRICNQLYQSCPEIAQASTIAIYSSYGSEVQLGQLHQILPDTKFAYPLCHPEGVLSFHEVSSPSTMTPGAHGILEPQNHPEVPLNQIDVILCPGIAFGRDHTRLGQGGGYYDRLLARKSKHTVCIGVAFHSQIIDTAPHHGHDIHMDRVVTEHGPIS